MHSCSPLPAAGASGPRLLLQLGRLIVRARSPAARRPRPLHAKRQAREPSAQVQQTQPKLETEEPKLGGVEAQLDNHVQALWNDQIPICIEVLLAPDCPDCLASISKPEGESTFDKQHTQQRAMLLERWTIQALPNKPHDGPAFITSQWLLNAVRSQLHFSQLSAWLARLQKTEEDPSERRRKLSRESCNYKKVEANCDEEELADEKRQLNIVYSIKIPGESYKMAEFSKPPTDHNFPISDIGDNVYLKVVLESLPRIDDIPTVKCTCHRKEPVGPEDLTGKLNDLTLGPRCSKFPSDHAVNSNIGTTSRRLSIVSNPGSTEFLISSDEMEKKDLVDDRMHTPCSENGKHKCSCDDESDGKDNHRSSTSLSQEPKKLDERRLKEIAKYKRRLRKESKMKKLSDSTSSEGDSQQKVKETHTSIPILQAARFDRLRAIGCYRNQTYLTLPASRIETKSPFVEAVSIPPPEFKRTSTVGTQTEDFSCQCGLPLQVACSNCTQSRLVRSGGSYDLAAISEPNGARRKCEDEGNPLKKHKCDINSSNSTCDIKLNDIVVDSSIVSDDVVKRPKLRRFFPIVGRLEKIVSDRFSQNAERDMEELHLKTDDTVFSQPQRPESKRQKTFSISEDDYVLYEKCDYGTIDKCEELSSPKDESGFKFPDPKRNQDALIPSPSEMDRFRWRFDSAASMVFHTKTGLPLTSSPAPLRRGNNCFDFDDSINGISGIKRLRLVGIVYTNIVCRGLALFHPISPPSPLPASPASPAPRSPPPAPPPRRKEEPPKLRIGPSTGLLGSFEESALKGRLEPVATVAGFTAELGASGAFCPPHRRLPVTVFFYAPGGTNAPYMGHINLGPHGYRVARSGTIQVSLFNPHGTLVKMFVVLYDLTAMPPAARTFLRQRTLYMPAGADPPARYAHKWLRYLIHLRFMTSKSGKLYLHTDIRIIVSRKADLDTATAHSLFRPIANGDSEKNSEEKDSNSGSDQKRSPNRVFGGSSEFDSEVKGMREIGYENQNGVSYELRSFTYAPENPKYSPR
ncbi:protein FAM214A isoform X1 [Ostrinia furnacalis]|uniref:protein FAM214A isoform X1 n=1 Tax=Ostrinia furnacalis TaxID=93504 RepID=UPI00103F7291|nr:protein FAM214A isoform X1 [Ostrinia furnacalis]